MIVGVGVVFVALPVQVHLDGGYLLGRHAGAEFGGVLHFAGACFEGTGLGGPGQAFLNGVLLAAHVAIAPGIPGVEHADGGDGPKTLVGLRSLDGIAATAANSQQAQTAGIGSGVLGDEIGCCADVLDAVLRLVGVAWRAAAAALICSVEGDGDITLLGKLLGIKTRDLLLHAPVGVGHHDDGVFLLGVVTGRCVDIGHHIDTGLVLGVFHRMDVYLAGLVCRDGIGIGEGEGVVLVV